MALTKFVRNVDDLSDDGGYKFRFRCDRCSDGVESQYVASSANILKTGLEIFSVFRPLGGLGQRAADGIDRGLRGKERDAAYEAAVDEAAVHFHKCSHCGQHVCTHCWNDGVSLCEGCAPAANEQAAQEAASLASAREVEKVRSGEAASAPQGTCPVCSEPAGGGKFCQACGAALGARACKHCQSALTLTAKFCGECGKPA